MDRPIVLKATGADLEGRIRRGAAAGAAVITHPHPLYGGDMDNAVVATVAEAYALAGWSVLRFNFRGTGYSTGVHEDGIGEQEDVRAAVAFLTDEGFRRIDLAGYSFGAWVLAGWSRRTPLLGARITMIAPPVAFVEFGDAPIPGVGHVITGSLDELAPPARIRTALPKWHAGARLSIIRGADHSFQGHLEALGQIIAAGIPGP